MSLLGTGSRPVSPNCDLVVRINCLSRIIVVALALMLTSGCEKDGGKGAAPAATTATPKQLTTTNVGRWNESQGGGIGSGAGMNAQASVAAHKWISPKCLPLSNEEPYYQEEAYQFLPGSYQGHALQCHNEGKYLEAIAEWK